MRIGGIIHQYSQKPIELWNLFSKFFKKLNLSGIWFKQDSVTYQHDILFDTTEPSRHDDNLWTFRVNGQAIITATSFR